MDFDSFIQMLDQAINSKIKEERDNAASIYYSYLDQFPIQFIEYSIKIIQTKHQLSQITIILLMKQTNFSYAKQSISYCNDELKQQLINVLIDEILTSKSVTAAKCIGNMSDFIMLEDDVKNHLLDFVVQCANQDDDYKLAGVIILSYIVCQPVQVLGDSLQLLLEIIQKFSESQNLKVVYHFLKMIKHFLAASHFIDEGDEMLDLDIQNELAALAFQKLFQSVEQIDEQNLKYFIEILSESSDIATHNLSLVPQLHSDIINLVDKLLETTNETIVNATLQFLGSIIDQEDYEFDEILLEQVSELIQTHHFQFFCDREENNQNLIQTLENPLDFCPISSIDYSYYINLYTICGKYYQMIYNSYQTFCQKNNVTQEAQILITEILLINKGIANDAKSIEEFFPILFEQLENSDVVVQFRLIQLFKKIQEQWIDELLQNKEKLMQLCFKNIFSNVAVNVIEATQLLAVCTKSFENSQIIDYLDDYLLVFEKYISIDNYGLQMQLIVLITVLISKFQSNLKLQEYSLYYIGQFMQQAPKVNENINTTEEKYFIVLINFVGTLICQNILPIQNDELNQIVNLFIMILISTPDGKFSLLIDNIIKTISQLALDQFKFDIEQIEPMVQKFIHLLDIKFSEANKNISSTQQWHYNSFVLNQHKEIIQTITILNTNFPFQMIKFIPNFIEVSKQSFEFQDYVRIFKFSMSIFSCLLQNGQNDDAATYYQECRIRLTQFITDENRLYSTSFQEATCIVEAFNIVLSFFSNDDFEMQVPIINQFIQITNQFSIQGTSGLQRYMQGLSGAKFNNEEKLQLYKNELTELIDFCCEYAVFVQKVLKHQCRSMMLDDLLSILESNVSNGVKATFLFTCLNCEDVKDIHESLSSKIIEQIDEFFESRLFLQPNAELIIECLKKQIYVDEITKYFSSAVEQLERKYDEWLMIVVTQMAISQQQDGIIQQLYNQNYRFTFGRRKMFGVLNFAIKFNVSKSLCLTWLIKIYANAKFQLKSCALEFLEIVKQNQEIIEQIWEQLDEISHQLLQE